MTSINLERELYELPGDLPTPSSIGSRDALRPAPLNFSRPRAKHEHSRGSVHQQEPLASPIEYTAGPQWAVSQPSVERAPQRDVIPEEGDEEEFEGNGHSYGDYDYDDAAPPPVVRTHSRQPQQYAPTQTSPGPGNTLIYKPYAESVTSHQDSDASSMLSSIAGATDDDGVSIAESADTSYSSQSDFTFDGRLGWNPRSNMSQAERERQRWSGPHARRGNGSMSSNGANAPIPVDTERTDRAEKAPFSGAGSGSGPGSGSGSHLQLQSTNSSRNTDTSGTSTGSAKTPAIPPRQPRIIKRTSFDQQSSRLELEQADSFSDKASSISSGEWQSSGYDVSKLPPEKLEKLRKKGINPALYAEMKAARKGSGKKRSFISPLTANTFLS